MRVFLALVFLAVATVPALAQSADVASEDLRLREQRASFYGALVPGTGHLYAGETGTGLTLLGLGIGVPVTAALATGTSSFGCSSRGGCDELDGGATLFLSAMAVGMGAWIYSWVDADNAVRRVAAGEVTAEPTVMSHGDTVAPGLAVRVRL